MTAIDTTAPDQSEEISFEIDLRHPPERVWRALTDPSLLAEWLLPAMGLRLEPGSSFTLQAPPQPGWDGVVHCSMLEIEKQQKLSYRWVVAEIDTLVTFLLTPTAAGTRLSILQSGFKPDQKRNFGGARYGWRMMGGKLVDLLAKIS